MAKAKKDETIEELAVEKQAEEAVSDLTTKKIDGLVEVEKETEDNLEKTTSTAKAGKRSAKAQKEADELKTKQERKALSKNVKVEKTDTKPKVTAKPPRSKLERAGKKFKDVAKLIDKNKTYSLLEAAELATKTSPTKFDATVEMHINLNVDPRQADQNIRSTLILPAGSGKQVRVAVLAEADDAKKALSAGADIAGLDNLFADFDKELINFDTLIATPATMAKLSKYARLLGPKGLMPNPKSGTVSSDVESAVKEAKAGKVEHRVDDNGIIHIAIGKVSFKQDKIHQNAQAVVDSVKSAKPVSVKGTYIKSAYLTTTMGPSIKLQLND